MQSTPDLKKIVHVESFQKESLVTEIYVLINLHNPPWEVKGGGEEVMWWGVEEFYTWCPADSIWDLRSKFSCVVTGR